MGQSSKSGEMTIDPASIGRMTHNQKSIIVAFLSIFLFNEILTRTRCIKSKMKINFVQNGVVEIGVGRMGT